MQLQTCAAARACHQDENARAITTDMFRSACVLPGQQRSCKFYRHVQDCMLPGPQSSCNYCGHVQTCMHAARIIMFAQFVQTCPAVRHAARTTTFVQVLQTCSEAYAWCRDNNVRENITDMCRSACMLPGPQSSCNYYGHVQKGMHGARIITFMRIIRTNMCSSACMLLGYKLHATTLISWH